MKFFVYNRPADYLKSSRDICKMVMKRTNISEEILSL